jgi:prevent-host-death family protein
MAAGTACDLDMAIIYSYNLAMKSVNIAELKNRLSHYLRIVRRGESVLVRDRNLVVARIEPVSPQPIARGDESSRLGELAQRGIIDLPREQPTASFYSEFAARRSDLGADLAGALLMERAETR